MDHDVLVEPWRDRCKGCLEARWPAPDRHRVASAARAILAQRRPGARDIVQATITWEAQQLTPAEIPPGCPEAAVTWVHTRPVSPATLVGERIIPVRTCPCRGGGVTFRPDARGLGVPATGECTDEVRDL